MKTDLLIRAWLVWKSFPLLLAILFLVLIFGSAALVLALQWVVGLLL